MLKQRAWLRHSSEPASADVTQPRLVMQLSGEIPAPPRPQLRPTVYQPSPRTEPMRTA